MNLAQRSIQRSLEHFFAEDDLERNFHYIQALPKNEVACQLKFKSDLVIAGLPFFVETMKYLDPSLELDFLLEYEGKKVKKDEKFQLEFNLPFSIALTGERLALNLLQRASAIATYANKYVEKANQYSTQILDTRKTTPGLRFLEKYAVLIGGATNHRLGQADVWMVKDNHKNFFGGLEEAIGFFKSQRSFYNSMVVEIHDLDELKKAIELGVCHVMLDNFSPEKIKEAIDIKPAGMTYEVSGGVRLENIDGYLMEGVDAISIGALTYDAPHVDISLKYHRK